MERSRHIITSDKVQIGYRIWRSGSFCPCLIMLHGLASNLTRWSEFVENTTLKEDWNLLRLDLRGHGTSMYRGGIGRQHWCNDLLAILEQEDLSQVILLGHSLGAQVAMQFYVTHPQRIQGLILIDPVFPRAMQGLLRYAKRFRSIVWVLIRLYWMLNFFGLRRRLLPQRDLRALDEKTRAILATNKDADLAQLYLSPLEDLKFIPTANYLQDLYEVVQPLPPLEDIDVPVLVLLSAGASVSRVETNLKIINQFPKGKTVPIDADHWLLTEKPEETRQIIECWCNNLRGKIVNNQGGN